MDTEEILKSLNDLKDRNPDDDSETYVSTFVINMIKRDSLDFIIRVVKEMIEADVENEKPSDQTVDRIVTCLQFFQFMLEAELTDEETKIRSIVEKETRND